METLRALRCEFSYLSTGLFALARARGFAFAYNEAKRSDEQAIINSIGQQGREALAQLVDGARQTALFKGLPEALRNNGKANGVLHSVHTLGLALDLDLYDKNGIYLANTSDHQQFGEWWEKQHTLARWGGRWGDGDHYSFNFNGVK